MRDLIAMVILVVFTPTIVFALVVTPVWWFSSLVRKRKFHVIRPIRALLASLVLELLFLFTGGLILGPLLGKTLGYAFPIIMLLLTLSIGLSAFIHFSARGIPHYPQIATWKRNFRAKFR